MNIESIRSLISLDQDRLLLGFGERKWMEKPLEDSPSFYFPDFFLKDQKPWFSHELTKIVPLHDLHIPSSPLLTKSVRPDYTFFSEQFQQIKQEMERGTLLKAVPYMFETFTEPLQPMAMLPHLVSYAKQNPVYLYGFWDDDEGILGATPEILFSQNDKETKSMALAGTCRQPLQLTQFVDDPKERKEHQLVVDAIQSALEPFGQVHVGSLSVLKLAHLFHLHTPISLKSVLIKFLDLVQALHPTPALGVLPKNSRWIKDYQTTLPRGRFGAPVGVQWEESRCYVAIRNMQWDIHGARIGAGCGVVQESQLDNEWNEIGAKIDSIKRILGICN